MNAKITGIEQAHREMKSAQSFAEHCAEATTRYINSLPPIKGFGKIAARRTPQQEMTIRVLLGAERVAQRIAKKAWEGYMTQIDDYDG